MFIVNSFQFLGYNSKTKGDVNHQKLTMYRKSIIFLMELFLKIKALLSSLRLINQKKKTFSKNNFTLLKRQNLQIQFIILLEK